VILDLDGTLVDSLDDITLILGRALAAHGRPEARRDDVRRWVGRGARSLVAEALGVPMDDPKVAPVLARYLAEYERDATPATRWIPGAEAFLDRLRAQGVAAVLCTNKPRAVCDAVVARFVGSSRITAIVAAGDVPRLKPHAEPVFAAMRAVSARPDECWMVGDGVQDALAARAAGVRSAIYLRGYGAPAAIAEAAPDATFDDYGALPAIVGIV
jgi:phosphoglycolate phosphatase